ncbi:hypothetical protein BN1723_002427 [Verticillium longisporum]|uniref:Uncharacterized protein n=1 Tax=Verticillium longisporum TaxID=100787 RepID=A0A0G4L5Q8_VERLO|nr:hypothetical protein BN1723_002427 [Verticillium longisporum]
MLVVEGWGKQYSQDDQGDEHDGNADAAAAAGARPRHAHALEDDDDKPEDGLDKVEDHVGLEALPLAVTGCVLGEELVADDDQGLYAL